MTRIIMCGCNGAMGRMITGIVNEDAEAEIVAGIDMVDTKEHCYPVFQKLADCDVEADALIDFSTPKILDDILTFSKEKKVPVVLCTTGYDDEQLAKIEEARKLHWLDMDLRQGTIRILHSKGHKDRLLYMPEDLTELLRTYEKVLYDKYHCLSDWVFPAREPERCLSNCTIDKKFREFWALTPYAEYCDKAPTVHCLRHTFVVKRMNLWMEEGIPLKEMLPFLSRYLGHQSPNETFYYYHQVAEAFRIIRSKDRTGKLMIPEVNTYE